MGGENDCKMMRAAAKHDKRVDAFLMLRSKGMITKAEFEQKRRRILKEI